MYCFSNTSTTSVLIMLSLVQKDTFAQQLDINILGGIFW